MTNFEFILDQISNLISLQERLAGANPVERDERLALTLRCLAARESFQCLSHRIQNLVEYSIIYCQKLL